MNKFKVVKYLWEFFKGKSKEEKSTPIEIGKYVFPCSSDECLVRSACTQACDKIVTNEDELRELFIKFGCCPDCGSTKAHEGPSGGAATNVKCSGCGHWFNMGLPLFVQRIHMSENGRFYD